MRLNNKTVTFDTNSEDAEGRLGTAVRVQWVPYTWERCAGAWRQQHWGRRDGSPPLLFLQQLCLSSFSTKEQDLNFPSSVVSFLQCCDNLSVVAPFFSLEGGSPRLEGGGTGLEGILCVWFWATREGASGYPRAALNLLSEF